MTKTTTKTKIVTATYKNQFFGTTAKLAFETQPGEHPMAGAWRLLKAAATVNDWNWIDVVVVKVDHA